MVLPHFTCPRIKDGLTFSYGGEYDVCTLRFYSSNPQDSGLKINKHTLADFRSSEYYLDLIAKQEAGEWPKGCENCLEAELKGQVSDRQFLLAAQPAGKYLHINASNLCDSDCVMCGPKLSTKIASRLKLYPDKESAYIGSIEYGVRSIWDDQNSSANLLIAAEEANWINVLGGEPMIDQKLWDFLGIAARPDLGISIYTNMNTFPDLDMLETISRFKTAELHVSIDAIKEQYEWIRHGLNWNKLLRNLIMLKQMKLKFMIHCEVQAHNLLDLKNHISFFNETGVHVSYKSISFPKLLRPRNAPRWVLEETLNELVSCCAPNDLIEQISRELLDHDPTMGTRLENHTKYLNSHRKHKFDTKTWRIL